MRIHRVGLDIGQETGELFGKKSGIGAVSGFKKLFIGWY